MPLNPNYATLAEARDFLRVTDAGDTIDDTELTLALAAASRAIDHATHRQFGLNGTAVARYYTPWFNDSLDRWVADIDDVMTTTGLVVKSDLVGDQTYTTTYLATQYRLWPYNAAGDGKAWWQLVFGTTAATPATGPGSLEVTANWGWTAVPDTIKEATLVQAGRFYKRRDAPFGVLGSPDMGNQIRLLAKVDADVAVMLQPFTRDRL